MIQELLGGGAGVIADEEKTSINTTVSKSSPFSSLSSSTNNTSSTHASSSSASNSQNQLRCPRCDSSNTKFCYYNNYNLTQPRHFCKTCRRYWTKGGALRNIPVGGGCRKNKSMISASPPAGSGRLKSSFSSEIEKSDLFQEFPSHHFLWASPQNSHLMSLFRTNQNPNPNAGFNPVSDPFIFKEESLMKGYHINSETSVGKVGSNGLALGLDQFNQVPSISICSPFWRSHVNQGEPQNGRVLGQERINQSLRSSTNCYGIDNHSPVLVMSNKASSSSTILESASVVAASDRFGYWNYPMLSSWSDLPSTPNIANGAYP